ncbi:MAG: preprotein translocase subunit Tim44 [Leptothrix sp. (in: Bacteria)]|nr:preprotein translocase subunit Tim44 [Leptothrix sp. (in: b-proteobacteria)]
MLSRLRRLRQATRRGPSTTPGVPAGAEVDEVLRLARQSFMHLQAAWDRADLDVLGHLATAALLDDLRHQLSQRAPGPNRTEVLELDARLLSLEDMNEALVASVEFSGLIRERHEGAGAPFRELWLLANVKAAGHGWKLARVQSLQ